MPLRYAEHIIQNTGVGRMAGVMPLVESQQFSATLAEIIAGKTILPPIPGFCYKVIDFLLFFAGTADDATDIRLSSTDGTPVDIATILIADAADGDKVGAVSAEAVLGAGFNAELSSGQGVLIRETGTTLTGTTGVTGIITYQISRA